MMLTKTSYLQTDVIQCDMMDVKECRNLFRDEVQRLNSSLVQFRQCCEDEVRFSVCVGLT